MEYGHMGQKVDRPRLCVIGPMIGYNPGQVTTQSQFLYELFKKEGYTVVAASRYLNRYRRFADILLTILTSRHLYDIVIMDIYSGPSFVVEDAASLLAKALGKPVVMVLHGGNLPVFMARFPNWAKRVLSRATQLVAPSEYLAESVRKVGLSCEVIPNIIQVEKYPYRHRDSVEPRLFWMRCYHPIWNPMMAVRVFARLKESFPQATLVMGGSDKGQKAEVERFARSHNLSSSVQILGFLNPEEKMRQFAAADIYVNTNVIDNMPVAVMEACTCGLPVVTTNVGGLPYLLKEGETGLLVDADDDEAMFSAIKRLVAEPELASRLSREGRKLALESSWENVKRRWESLFSQLK